MSFFTGCADVAILIFIIPYVLSAIDRILNFFGFLGFVIDELDKTDLLVIPDTGSYPDYPVLLSYVNSKIEELDGRKQALVKEIAAMTAEAVSPEQIERISGYLDTWEKVSFDDRRQVVEALVSSICATSEKIEIQWKI